MTVQKKQFVTLDEIRALHFECDDCHAIAVIPIDDMRSVPYTCVNCGRGLLQNHHAAEKDIRSWIDCVRNLKGADVHFRLSLEINVAGEERATT